MRLIVQLLALTLTLVLTAFCNECKADSRQTELYYSIDSISPQRPAFTLRVEGKDTLICFTPKAFRRLDYWLEDRVWLIGQNKLLNQAVDKCNQLTVNQTLLTEALTKERDYFRKLARRRNTTIVIGGIAIAGITTALIAIAVKK